jgi:AAA+ superfamily predicted ATPase
VSQVNVLVVGTVPDILAESIAIAVSQRSEFELVGGRVMNVKEAEGVLGSPERPAPCGVILVGSDTDTKAHADRIFGDHKCCVVMRVNAPLGVGVKVTTHQAGLPATLTTFAPQSTSTSTGSAATRGPLLDASVNWVHDTLKIALSALAGRNGALPGLTLDPGSLLEQMESPRSGALDEAGESTQLSVDSLRQALAANRNAAEPLAVIARIIGLDELEFGLLLLALAPELDIRYQRCLGVLHDDMSRRAGSLGLYATLLGERLETRIAIGGTSRLVLWRLLETHAGSLPPADEPLRIDAAIAAWILGDRDALMRDARLRRVCRTSPWPGSSLLDFDAERAHAARWARGMRDEQAPWLVFSAEDPADWRALLELGTPDGSLLRIEASRFATLDSLEMEECAVCAARAARLTGMPLVVDTAGVLQMPEAEQSLRTFFATLAARHCRITVLTNEMARLARMLGPVAIELVEGAALTASSRAEAFAAAATGAGAPLAANQARDLAPAHPLHVEGFERAMSMARGTLRHDATPEQAYEHFTATCKRVAAEGMSHLAERIEPMFSLDDVVLPADRKLQLQEIVDNVRFASRVLGDWKFGEQLPYGRGVTVLLHGPSGTGKTMAALGIASRLGAQVLRIDLSRVVSKYIGDTEKNIDRVFADATRSGATLLIDEAEALLGKRSEVKDAHDRYANIEVVYLLQRMEAYEGLAILTTNLRQNLDSAFLRRLRFIVDFPRPDVEAREQIWRHCLPPESHVLSAGAFRQLARRIDLTGGHIRQITLRAAFVAAAANRSIGLEHVAYAANAELAKVGQSAVALELLEGRVAA